MNKRLIACIPLLSLLAACPSLDGLYAPACVAYAGNTIELRGDHFVWRKFTDAVVLDSDGNVVDQFPGYPLQGTYRVDGGSIVFESAQGETDVTMFPHRQDGHNYLLTGEQRDVLTQTGKLADCALVRKPDPER